jgi:hypothetical protein
MTVEISPDGLFRHLWAFNKQAIQVFPHLKSKRGSDVKGLEITLTGNKKDYHLVDLNRFIRHIANGDFNEIGRVRMKSPFSSESNGFAIRTSLFSEALLSEIHRL